MSIVENSVDIKSQVREFVVNNFLFGNTETSFEDGDSFLEKGIIDSTGILELIDFLEEQYGVSVEDSELVPENLDSLDNVAAYVSRKTAAGA